MTGTKRRSTRQAASRKRSLYVDPDTDDDFEVQSDEELVALDLDAPAPSSPKRRKPEYRRKPATRSRTKSKQPQRSVGRPRRPNTHASPPIRKEFSGPSDHRIPAWASLPADLLKDIFVFASVPTYEYSRDALRNADWLLKTARTCRAFALPALEAFYQSPAMFNRMQPHEFLDLLKLSEETRFIDYNVKVKGLLMDVRCIAGNAPNKPRFDLSDLIMHLPQLRFMEILYPDHLPPYRSVDKIQRWTLPAQHLFDSLDRRNIRLKGWRWSRDFLPPRISSEELYTTMASGHESRAFEHLERLVVAGFNVEGSAEPPGVDDITLDSSEPVKAVPGLANSIARLPGLKDLSFICCDLVMNRFLQRLPRDLQRLELTNCLEITSDMLRTYFASSGLQLRELVLNHNPALNFSFFTGLKTLCPRLETLVMDLQYYSERDNINDADPLYDELLSAEEMPTWPSPLQRLELTHVQKLTAQAAENLFRSLVDGATDLMLLRKLVIHAHINIPWRDRVGFRDQWIGRLRRVYLRRCRDPCSYLGSFRQHRLWKQAQGLEPVIQPSTSPSIVLRLNHDRPGIRKVSHVLVSQHNPPRDEDKSVDSDASQDPAQGQPRRSKRVAENISQASKVATPEPESGSSTSDEEGAYSVPDSAVQGLCETVDVRIDNQRPRENQFTEGDFLDSEASGDEDWREDAEENDEDGYAW